MGGTYTSAQANDPSVGVIPRVIRSIFEEREKRTDCEFCLAISYLEVGEHIIYSVVIFFIIAFYETFRNVLWSLASSKCYFITVSLLKCFG